MVVQKYWKHGLLYLREYLGITPRGDTTMAEVAGGLRAWAELPLVPELSTAERQEIRACTARILNARMRKWSRAPENQERESFTIDYLRAQASMNTANAAVPLCFGRSEMSALAEHVLLRSVR